MSTKIRVILLREGAVWVAQGLEHDVCVQADSIEELYGRFDVAVRLEADEPGGLERIPEAPEYYHSLWDKKAGDYKPVQSQTPEYDFGVAAYA